MKSLKSTRVGRVSAKNTAGAKSAKTATAAKKAAAAATKVAAKAKSKTTTRAKRPAVKTAARATETKKKSQSATRNQALAIAREALQSGIALKPGAAPSALHSKTAPSALHSKTAPSALHSKTAPSARGEELLGARKRLAEALAAGEALAADLERERARNEGLEATVTQLNEQLALQRAAALEPAPAFGVPSPAADAAFEAAVDEALEQARVALGPEATSEIEALRASLAAEHARREQLEVEKAQALSQAQLEREQRLAAMERSVETANQTFAQWQAELEAAQRRAAAVPELERELGVVRAERDELLLLRSEAQARCAAVEAELLRIEHERDEHRERAHAQAERIEFLEHALALRAPSVESFPPDGCTSTPPAPDWHAAPPPPPPPGGLFGES